ncbi:hypothetical protein K493DRAFT_64253 [Basidiobolus meristosporus CBS 931.73]|uniref:ABM domain-containing protein n=1 Tax=Basidiobolus meristosporus CBS 931.73 TaxID=1314790 RepID=A0A1Y1XVV6_9FUNG|nr:hypothetical protein K493DRAFT_64253 [Basidiobolus meristosporus CBS 931.73]|eukprot:ORX89889.1 hypothetical protein K493DRAFT_64253 [Basidiobolus meristosporus CBS 931.73]
MSHALDTLIYEVNISVPKDKGDEYLDWLRSFARNTCDRVDGFLSVNVFSQPKPAGLFWLSEEGCSKIYFTIHYTIQSQDHLEAYLQNEQPEIAKAEFERFHYLVTSRRVLKVLM